MKLVTEMDNGRPVADSQGAEVIVNILLQTREILWGYVLRRSCREFTGELRLNPKEITDILLLEWCHNKSSPGYQFDIAFALKCSQTLANRGRAHSHFFRDSF
nr:hypothetical protein [Arthrobacter sp. FW306-2-2C-D06B]